MEFRFHKTALGLFIIFQVAFAFPASSNDGCSPCDPGYYVIKPCSQDQETECAPCKQGSFTDYLNHLSGCKLCTECSEGSYPSAECSTTTDTVCAPCSQILFVGGTKYASLCSSKANHESDLALISELQGDDPNADNGLDNESATEETAAKPTDTAETVVETMTKSVAAKAQTGEAATDTVKGTEAVTEANKETEVVTEANTDTVAEANTLLVAETNIETEVVTETATETNTEAVIETSTEAVTVANKETEAVTEAKTEAVTEANTEAVTEANTEAVIGTNKDIEVVTEANTEAVTEAKSEAETEANKGAEDVTEANTEAVTDAIKETEVVTEPNSETVTEENKETEAVAEANTEMVNEANKETEAVTEANTEVVTEVNTDAVTEENKETEEVTNSNAEVVTELTEETETVTEAITEAVSEGNNETKAVTRANTEAVTEANKMEGLIEETNEEGNTTGAMGDTTTEANNAEDETTDENTPDTQLLPNIDHVNSSEGNTTSTPPSFNTTNASVNVTEAIVVPLEVKANNTELPEPAPAPSKTPIVIENLPLPENSSKPSNESTNPPPIDTEGPSSNDTKPSNETPEPPPEIEEPPIEATKPANETGKPSDTLAQPVNVNYEILSTNGTNQPPNETEANDKLFAPALPEGRQTNLSNNQTVSNATPPVGADDPDKALDTEMRDIKTDPLASEASNTTAAEKDDVDIETVDVTEDPKSPTTTKIPTLDELEANNEGSGSVEHEMEHVEEIHNQTDDDRAGHVGAAHGDTDEDDENKKRTAIIVGVAVGGVAIFAILFFTTRKCRNRGKATPTPKSNDDDFEFKPLRQIGPPPNSDDDGGHNTNGIYRQGPKMGPPSPRMHRKSDGKFEFPEVHAVPPAKSENSLNVPNSFKASMSESPLTEPLLNDGDQFKYIDESTDDELGSNAKDKLLPDAKLSQVVEMSPPSSPAIKVSRSEGSSEQQS